MPFSKSYCQARLDVATKSLDDALVSVQWTASGRSNRHSDQINLYQSAVTFWQRELDRATGKEKAVVSIRPASL